jgi:hypothetical protein
VSIIQAIDRLKAFAGGYTRVSAGQQSSDFPSQGYLVVTDLDDSTRVMLRQSSSLGFRK